MAPVATETSMGVAKLTWSVQRGFDRVYVERTYLREALNRESGVQFRYVIQPSRTPDLSGFYLPRLGRRGHRRGRDTRPLAASVAALGHSPAVGIRRHSADYYHQLNK